MSGQKGPSGAARPRGVVDRIMATWRDPRGEMSALLSARPSEATLLSFLMIAALFSFAGGAAELSAAPRTPGEAGLDQYRRELFERFIGAFFLAPLGVYAAAALATPVLRRYGGSGDGYATRAAFAWALAAVAPLLLIGDLARAFADPGGAAAYAGLGVAAITGAAALWIWAICLAAAHQYRSALPILGAVFGAAALLVGIALAVGAFLR